MVETIEITSEQQWMELRRVDLTASTVAAPPGLHPYVSAAQIYAEKSGRALPTPIETSVMRRGKRLEPLVLPLVRDKLPGCEVVPAHEYLRDPECRLGATPDAYIIRPGGELSTLQIKTVGRRTFKRNWVDGMPPLWITLQSLCESCLKDAAGSIVAAFIFDEWSAFDEVELFDVPRHEASEQRIRNIAREFWAAIAANRQPAFDFLRDAKLIAALWPHEVKGKVVDLGADNELPMLFEERERIIAEIDAREQRQGAIDAELRFKMGDADTGIGHGWRITLREIIRKAHAVKESRYRQLRVARVE